MSGLILEIATILLTGLNIFQFIFFRATKKKYVSDAERAEAEAAESKQSSLERRIATLEEMYNKQSGVVDDLHAEILRLSTDKFESDKRIIKLESVISLLESENKNLKEKMALMDTEIQAYKTITRK